MDTLEWFCLVTMMPPKVCILILRVGNGQIINLWRCFQFIFIPYMLGTMSKIQCLKWKQIVDQGDRAFHTLFNVSEKKWSMISFYFRQRNLYIVPYPVFYSQRPRRCVSDASSTWTSAYTSLNNPKMCMTKTALCFTMVLCLLIQKIDSGTFPCPDNLDQVYRILN